VRWERLRLRGFGRHRDLRLDLPDGVATWVAANEAGKSTAVLGLVATVWGLPHLQDTGGFAWGRFRAFEGGPHRGEVTFARDGARYTVAASSTRTGCGWCSTRPTATWCCSRPITTRTRGARSAPTWRGWRRTWA
jgi:hypothetical protein